MGQPHVAVFETKQDLGFEGGTLLTVILEHNYGGKHILGKLELRSRHQVTEWVSHTDLAR